MAYNAKVYRKQGGTEMVVADGGTLTIEDGATFTVDSEDGMELLALLAAIPTTNQVAPVIWNDNGVLKVGTDE